MAAFRSRLPDGRAELGAPTVLPFVAAPSGLAQVRGTSLLGRGQTGNRKNWGVSNSHPDQFSAKRRQASPRPVIHIFFTEPGIAVSAVGTKFLPGIPVEQPTYDADVPSHRQPSARRVRLSPPKLGATSMRSITSSRIRAEATIVRTTCGFDRAKRTEPRPQSRRGGTCSVDKLVISIHPPAACAAIRDPACFARFGPVLACRRIVSTMYRTGELHSTKCPIALV